MQGFSAVEKFHCSPQSACTITTQYHAADGRSVTGTPVQRQNGLLLLLRVRAAEVGPSRPILRRNRMSVVGGKAADVDSRAQSSRLAEFGGRGMSFNICRGTLGSFAMFTALSDGELDELFEAAFDEAMRRGRLPPSVRTEMPLPALRPSELTTKRLPQTEKRRRVDIAEVSLTRGQVNAIRASFKAGITPSRIARQFGVSLSNVRKALATDPSK
jgi:hypothetical protein